ncbi:hypothetical protein, partial [Geodermatophilus arenarius]
MAGGRRRTDHPSAPLPDLPTRPGPGVDPGAAELSDHPTTPGPGRSRADRRRDALLGAADETDRRRLTGRSARPAVAARPAAPAP